MPFLRLFKRFILRALWREKVRCLVAVAGIALGVAVMVAIRLANLSVVDTFAAAVDSVGGNSSLRIRGTAGRFDEQLLKELDWVKEFGRLSPVIEAQAMDAGTVEPSTTLGSFPRGNLLHVLGVDILLDFPLRDYKILKTSVHDDLSSRDVLGILGDPQSIILTEKYLRRRGLRVGDTISLVFDTQPREFTIRGLLLDRGPARMLDGNFALLDIAAAQLAANRLGTLDYIDVLLEDDADLDEATTGIRERLPSQLVVELPDAASGRSETMLSAFQFNLAALSAVALVVGLFLIYNTVSMSVAARRDEIGMLQAAGASRMVVLWLFPGEAILLASVGVVLGIPAGRLLATGAVTATAQTVETFYIQGVAEASAAALRLTPSDICLAAVVSVTLALVASLVPAWEAASVPPVDAARGIGARYTPARVRLSVVIASICALVGLALTACGPVGGVPIWGFVGELMFMFAGAFCAPLMLVIACRFVQGLANHVSPFGCIEMKLAAANLLGALPRVSVSVAALSISLSMMVAIAVMVGSFRDTVVYWLDAVLCSDLQVKPIMHTSAVSDARISERTRSIVESHPRVADSVWFSCQQIPYEDRHIRISATELTKSLAWARLAFKSPPDGPSRESLDEPTAVLVSESYSLIFDKQVGDEITLPTPTGKCQLQIAGVYYDYASNQGTVMMDVDEYRRHFATIDAGILPQALSIFLRSGSDREAVRQQIVSELGPTEQVYCVTNSEIREEAMRIFDSTFMITYALQVIAIGVAGMGVASTLITLIYHRRREIGLLSLVGASFQQIRRMILIEAVMLGLVSQLIGIGLGFVLAAVLIFVINVQSFGWTIQMRMPGVFLIQSTLLVMATSVVFGLYPAVSAASANALKAVRQE